MHYKIRIVKYAGGGTVFIPEGGAAGQALSMATGDSVHWANETNEEHLPWPYNADKNDFFDDPFADELSESIKPQTSSVAVIMAPLKSVDFLYRCKCRSHLDEMGRITVNVPSDGS